MFLFFYPSLKKQFIFKKNYQTSIFLKKKNLEKYKILNKNENNNLILNQNFKQSYKLKKKKFKIIFFSYFHNFNSFFNIKPILYSNLEMQNCFIVFQIKKMTWSYPFMLFYNFNNFWSTCIVGINHTGTSFTLNSNYQKVIQNIKPKFSRCRSCSGPPTRRERPLPPLGVGGPTLFITFKESNKKKCSYLPICFKSIMNRDSTNQNLSHPSIKNFIKQYIILNTYRIKIIYTDPLPYPKVCRSFSQERVGENQKFTPTPFPTLAPPKGAWRDVVPFHRNELRKIKKKIFNIILNNQVKIKKNIKNLLKNNLNFSIFISDDCLNTFKIEKILTLNLKFNFILKLLKNIVKKKTSRAIFKITGLTKFKIKKKLYSKIIFKIFDKVLKTFMINLKIYRKKFLSIKNIFLIKNLIKKSPNQAETIFIQLINIYLRFFNLKKNQSTKYIEFSKSSYILNTSTAMTFSFRYLSETKGHGGEFGIINCFRKLNIVINTNPKMIIKWFRVIESKFYKMDTFIIYSDQLLVYPTPIIKKTVLNFNCLKKNIISTKLETFFLRLERNLFLKRFHKKHNKTISLNLEIFLNKQLWQIIKKKHNSKSVLWIYNKYWLEIFFRKFFFKKNILQNKKKFLFCSYESKKRFFFKNLLFKSKTLRMNKCILKKKIKNLYLKNF